MTDEPITKPPVEKMPSRNGEVSAIASANAPFLYFEDVATLGHQHGIVRLAVSAARVLPTGPDSVGHDQVVVAHLRMPIPTARRLKEAIEKVLLMVQPAEGGPKPN